MELGVRVRFRGGVAVGRLRRAAEGEGLAGGLGIRGARGLAGLRAIPLFVGVYRGLGSVRLVIGLPAVMFQPRPDVLQALNAGA